MMEGSGVRPAGLGGVTGPVAGVVCELAAELGQHIEALDGSPRACGLAGAVADGALAVPRRTIPVS